MSRPPFGFQPGRDDDDRDDDRAEAAGPVNPFEALFGGTGGMSPDVAGKIPLFAELEKLLSWRGGPVNWDLARQMAIRAAANQDQTVTSAQRTAVTDALRLADLWLDPVTTLPSAGASAEAWTRVHWVETTLPVWTRLCDPVAAKVVQGMGSALPEEARSLAGPLLGMMNQVGGLMFGVQVGQAIGSLAGEVFGPTDIGLPLGPAGRAALLPQNVAAFGSGLAVEADQVRLFVALREVAHQRLFGHVDWLAGHLFGLVETYASGIDVDTSGLDRVLGQLDPMNLDPEALQQMLGEGLFSPQPSPGQQAALTSLETALALVEGWVDEVVASAATEHLPGTPALRETLRRRRASGGPAEQTFASLVGLELRPRRLRDAAELWRHVRDVRGVAGRDAVWSAPELLPGSADLDDPASFARREEDIAAAVADLDDQLRQLRDGDDSPES